MKECIFCRIIQGEFEASVIYEDELVMCVMDIEPISKGHVLIVPREHKLDLDELTHEEAGRVMEVSRRLVKVLKERYEPRGYSIMQNGGKYNDIGHYHMHVFPRYDDTDFGWVSACVEEHDIEEVGRQLAEDIGRVL